MAIITISRELAALGDETAHELAKLLDYRLLDKQTLEDRIKSYGVTNRKLEKYDERKPSFFASLSQDRDDYLHYLRTALISEASQGNCIIIGRGANAVFRDLPGVLSVFLVSPLEIRCGRVKNYFHCDERRARQIIDQSDRDRTGYHRYFFDTEWKEPANYHLTLNTGHLHPSLCADMIKSLWERIITPEKDAQNACRLKELCLGQRVVHHLLYEKGVPVHFLEASVDGTGVTLFGVANSQALVEAAVAAAREVPLVSAVGSEIQVVQEYTLMH
jgi:cytidylate kinase